MMMSVSILFIGIEAAYANLILAAFICIILLFA